MSLLYIINQIYRQYFMLFYFHLFLCFSRSVLTGLLGYTFLFTHRWEYLFLFIGVSGIGWGFLLRWLSRRHASKIHYQLLDSSPKHEPSNDNNNNNNNSSSKPPSFFDVPWRSLMKQGPVL